MKKAVIMILCLLCLTGCSQKKQEAVSKRMWFDYFDTVITAYVYNMNEGEFNTAMTIAEDKIAYYDEQFSIFKDGDNNLYDLNRDRVITASDELVSFLEYCIDMYELTDGKLNIMSGALTAIWKDVIAGKRELPTEEELRHTSEHISIDSLRIDGSKVYIDDDEAMIDVGAVAKGYTGQILKEMFADKDMAFDMGGNIVMMGDREWKSGIRDPRGSDVPLMRFSLSGMCLVTSGNYERYIEIDKERYHHIIDTETLYPSDKYLSVTVVANDSALSDALSTALFCMDISDAEKLVSSLDGVEAVFLQKDGKIIKSSGIDALVIH